MLRGNCWNGSVRPSAALYYNGRRLGHPTGRRSGTTSWLHAPPSKMPFTASRSTYIRRVVDSELDVLLGDLPAILVEGPKGVGKTSTARQRVASAVRLDNDPERAVLEADVALVLQRERPLLVDEWQRFPPVFDTIRRAIDDDHRPNQFILTGSASPSSPATHSGAGRIPSLRMRPLSLAERGIATPTVSLATLLTGARPPISGASPLQLADYTREILQSGFPGLRHLSGRAHRAQLDGYLERIVDRDFEDASGRRVRYPRLLRRWLTAYAAAISTTATQETIRDAATGGESEKPARSSTTVYREVLEHMWIVDPIPAWVPSQNAFAPLVHAPKHQLADPALAARLHGLDQASLLGGTMPGVADSTFETPNIGQLLTPRAGVVRDGTWLGRLFESLVSVDVRVYAQAAEAHVRHLRTANGRHEVDLIAARADGRVLAIEVKLGAVVDDEDVKHLRWLRHEVGGDLLDAVVIHTGPDAYRRRDGIAVVPAALLGP